MTRKKPSSAPLSRVAHKVSPLSPSPENPRSRDWVPTLQAGFPIVGVGASAGGLEAFKQFLSSLAVDTGMAFVLIQHLDPKHESLSTDILSRITSMPVAEVTNGMRVEPNHIYIIPPNFGMEIFHGVLKLIPRVEIRGQHMAIDSFFRSLADDRKNLAAGVVLSGTGSDGTEGLLAIKAEGGITFAQTPASAKFDSMPRSAISSESVDLVLSPQKIAEELAKIAHHRFIFPAKQQAEITGDRNAVPLDSLQGIFLLLRKICHVDFTHYKSNTIQRRLERRMILNRVEDIDAYIRLLSGNPDEVKALYADILIHVTSFFRDPKAFEAVSREVFPRLMKGRAPGLPIRIWIPGCSTGEEVYSIAILIYEFLSDRAVDMPVQIFASDISEPAIQKARIGEYPASISRDVSPERLDRFFGKLDNGHYKVKKTIRDICLFSRHDITVNPPFAKMDFISCRNLLIYFAAALQKHVIPVFHYALVPKGLLWLGRSETTGGFSNLFSVVDKTNQLYMRKNAPIALSLQFPVSTYVAGKQEEKQESVRKYPVFAKQESDVQRLADVALQAEYPGVLVNEEMEILQFRGRTAPFIEPAAGLASYHLLKMARPEIIPDLRVLIQAAKKKNTPARAEQLHFKDGRRVMTFNLKVIPVKASSASKENHYLILFENVVESSPPKKKKGPLPGVGKLGSGKQLNASKNSFFKALQQELISSQESQTSLIEKYEATQEDLGAANEELQSANEELQSTNEELETAKEELQSSNEELTTVNDELQSRSVEQVQLGNDLINLLGSVEIPILMLGNDRRIRRFTPLAGKVLNLIATDVARPISDLKLNFTSPGIDLDLDHLVSEVLDTMKSTEVEVQDRQARWFRLQVRPYKTIDNKIDGVVLALVDIDVLKQSLNEVRAARAEAEKANRGKDLFLATLSHELRTPLTSILSWAQMIRMEKVDPEKAKKGIAIIEESGRAQAQLIDDLLDVSRIVAGKLSLELREVDPSAILRAAIESVRAITESKSIHIETAFNPHVGTVMADPVRLQQVFWNLLSNAAKFSVPESRIVVKLDRLNGQAGGEAQAMIQVQDSGKGIDPEFLPHIFDRFSQEDSSSVRLHGGLGLGLAIVQNLVELHGGTIRAESLSKKPGTTFTVLLPLRSNDRLQELPSLSGEEATHEIQLQGIRVLVVDDEVSTREVLTEILLSFGAETQACDSVREALVLIPQFRPDVLVSDIAMPGEDGYTLIRKLRALSPEQGGGTPAMAVTAYAGADDARRALAAGFQVHLAKPFDGPRFAKVLLSLVNRHRHS
jgi:two-component system, chemotaxis family, CheB/CheR fusion protein